MAGSVRQDQTLAVLYDLALTIGGEVAVTPLLTRTLQRLLYHTGFSVGIFLSDIAGDGDGYVSANIEATVGDFALIRHQGERLRLPLALVCAQVNLEQAPDLIASLPLRKQQKLVFRVPVGDSGVILLLAPQMPATVLPLAVILAPVAANLAKALALCRSYESTCEEVIRHYAESQLVQRLYGDIFNRTRDGILITDCQQLIVDVNASFSRVTGYAREEVLGKTPRMLASGRHDAIFYADMWRSIREKGYWKGEIWNQRKNGDHYPGLLSIGALRDGDGNILHYFGILTDISSLNEVQWRLERLAHYDFLTDLPNRFFFGDSLEQAVASARRRGHWVAVACFDIDHFHRINETHGRSFGDKLTVAFAQRLHEALVTGEVAGRLSSEHFAVILPDLDHWEEAEPRLIQLISRFGAPFIIGDQEIMVSTSTGVTLFPADDSDTDTLLRHAQIALHQTKDENRGGLSFFDAAQDRRARERRALLARVKQALTAGELRLFYQPKVRLSSGEIIGFEALLRWFDPDRGVVSPGEFLPMVETSPLIIDIGNWVMREALRQAAVWRESGLETTVSVNVAALHLQQPDFVDQVRAVLADTPDAPAGSLDLEILESVAMENLAHVSAVIDTCRTFGVLFALDDFGTGYSSLAYLKRLPVDILKIDQSFVRDMLNDDSDLAVVEGVISLAQAFRRQVIAEGVETAEQGAQLIRLGCDVAQGYGIARPMPGDAVLDWVRDFKPDPSWVS